MSAISVRDLEFWFPDGTHALKGVNLDVEECERSAILGPNGAGKSTLLQHFNGIYAARKGTVEIFGELITKENAARIRERVGMIFQDPDDQLFMPTVFDDVAFGPINMGLSKEEVEDRVHHALDAVGMVGFKSKTPYHLSQGQKKRIAIAGVLAMDPDIYILDEPTTDIDPSGKNEILGILDDLSKRGKTIVIATHDVDLVAKWAEKVIIIENGKTLAEGGVEILTNREIVESASLSLPTVSQIFIELVEQGEVANPVPKTVEEAINRIRELIN